MVEFPKKNKEVKVTPRTKPDLPKHLVGNAIWKGTTETRTGAYYPSEESHFAIEYLNNNWYYLDWAPETSGYYCRRTDKIEDPLALCLGTELYPYHQPRKGSPKESSSELGEELDIGRESEEDTPVVSIETRKEVDDILSELVNKNLSMTTTATQIAVQLAQPLNVQGGGPPGGGGPAPHGQPGGGGPLGGGPPGGGPPGGGPPGGGPPGGPLAGGVPGRNVPGNGGLKGQPPILFAGDRKKTLQFMKEFQLFRIMNR